MDFLNIAFNKLFVKYSDKIFSRIFMNNSLNLESLIYLSDLNG